MTIPASLSGGPMRRSISVVVIAVAALVASSCVSPLTPPPGDAPLRYRDAVFTNVDKTSDVVYGSALNLAEPDRDAQARRLPAERRHRDESACDRVGARRIVQQRRQDLARAGRRGEHVRQEGLRQRLDQLPADAGWLLGRRARPRTASPPSSTPSTTRRRRCGSSAPTPPPTSVDPEPHRNRRHVGRGDHRVERRLRPDRGR